MNICTVLGLLIAAHFIQGLLGLPVDRELFRVKRKGETEVDHDEELFRKVRRSQDDKEIEIKHIRRFFAPETTDSKLDEVFKTKMEARSSRSSREDNDVTEKRPERFQLQIQKRSSDKSGSHLVTGDTSGSGDQPGEKSTSGSGLWSSKSSSLKQTEKRSMSVNSLSSLISALKAITSLAPEGEGTSGDEIDSSGSGFWLAPEKEVDDDKLPKFFQQETNSVSEENPEEALSMISEAAEKELNKKVEDTSSEKTNPATGVNIFRRELKSDLLADDLMSALENKNESHDDQPDDDPTLSSGSAMYEKEDEITEQPEEDEISGQPEEQFIEKPEVSSTTEVGSTPEVWSTPEVKPTPDAKSVRSLTEVLLPDSFYRAKRSSQENVFLRSDNYLGVNDALDSDSLVARFYHEQDTHADAPEVTETSVASLPSETEAVSSTEKQAKPEKRETYFEHSLDFSEPRVVYKREIRNAPEPIIERPAVYSRNEDENEMDSSFGGEDDDDDEATLMIHEREIREDGYVGCYEDKSPDRDLPTVLSVPHLTPDSCRNACQGAGHAYAGVQYGYLCRCGDSYGKYTKVPDEECDALCTGDKAQKCGGFWRSAVFTTAGAMQPSKRGNFFHIDSVQPITEDIFDIPRSEIPSGDEQSGETSTITESATVTESAAPSPEQPAPAHDEQSGETSTITESATVTESAAPSPEKQAPAHDEQSGETSTITESATVTESAAPSPEQPATAHDEQSGETSTITESATVTESAAPGPEQPAPAYESTVPESSGAYTQDTHRETSLQESPVPSTPGVTVNESPMPSTSEEMALDDDSVAQALSAQSAKEDVSLAHESVDETTHINEETSRAHKPDSVPANNSAPAHDIMPTSAPADNPEPPPQASQRSNNEAPPQQVTVPLDSPVSINQEASHIQHDHAPQGTHASQLVYLHQQQDILSKPTPKTIVAVPPGKVEAGNVAYTGTIKLKQSWLDQFEDANSAESKILTGNIEQAFKRVFKNEPKFVNAEVMGFREGLVKHNPNTIRKVIAPFIVTFKNGAEGVEEKLKNMVKNFGKLDDMPVYKNSLQIAEYGHSPAAEKEKAVRTDDTGKEKHKSEEEKRSAVNIPNGGVDPFLKDIFSQIST